jgi:hypothetical protein
VGQTAHTDSRDKKGPQRTAPAATAVLRVSVTGCSDHVITVQDGKSFSVVMDNPVTKERRADPAAAFRVHADLNATPHVIPADDEVQSTGMSHILLACKGFSGGSRFTYTGQALRVGGQPIVGSTGRPDGRQAEMRLIVERVDVVR